MVKLIDVEERLPRPRAASIPTPEDSLIPGMDTEGTVLREMVLSTVTGGTPGGTRTPDARLRTPPLYPLSYRGLLVEFGNRFGVPLKPSRPSGRFEQRSGLSQERWRLSSIGNGVAWWVSGTWRHAGGPPQPLPRASDQRTVAGDRAPAPLPEESHRRFPGRSTGSMPEPA